VMRRLIALAIAMLAAPGLFDNARAQGQFRPPLVVRENATARDRPAPSLVVVGIAADLPIWKRVTLGTFKSANAIREALDREHVHIGDSANEALGRPAFAFTSAKVELDLVVVAVTDLGFGAAGAPRADIYARAAQLGLELCPAEVAPYLRLQYLQQPVGEILQIAMQPVATYGGDPVDLAVADGGEGLLLVGGEAFSDRVASGAVRFVFVRPRRAIVSTRPDLR